MLMYIRDRLCCLEQAIGISFISDGLSILHVKEITMGIFGNWRTECRDISSFRLVAVVSLVLGSLAVSSIGQDWLNLGT
jgi:hypothetical protein